MQSLSQFINEALIKKDTQVDMTPFGHSNNDPRYKRKTTIKKGNADYILYCVNLGKMTPSGKTGYNDVNIWEEFKDLDICLGFYGRSFLIVPKDSIKPNDKVLCVDNFTLKKLPGALESVQAVSKCDIDDFRDVFRKTWPSRCKRPSYQFGKKSDGLPWQRMGQIYLVKKIEK